MNRLNCRIFALLALVALLAPLALSADFEAPPPPPPLPSVNVTDNCVVVDTDGASHAYSGQYLGICALAAAKEQGAVSAYTLQNFPFGLFLQTLNGIAPGATEFWSISLNGAEAMVGLSDLVVAQGDTLSFQLTDWTTSAPIGPPISFQIALSPAAGGAGASGSSSGGGEFLSDRHFNVESAFDFLVAKQRADGSFGSPMLTDWAAIAFGAATDEVCNDACPAAIEKLRTYLSSAPIPASSATDLERHIMALEAIGIDPYTKTGAPVDALMAKFDGAQMGDASLVNDDIFAIFPLLHAGYAKTDPMIESIISFVLSKQKPSGSWEESVDLTAAAIQALALFPERAETRHAIEKAKEFVRRNQNESGIWGSNSFTLSWVLQAIAALGESPRDWKKSGVTPLGYLGVLQQDDGGVEPMTISEETRIWATSYAIPAAFGKPWHAILKDFSRPAEMPSAISSETAPPPLSTTHATIPEKAPPAAPETTAATTATNGAPEAYAAAAVGQTATNDGGAWLWLLGGLLAASALAAASYYLSFRNTKGSPW